MNTQEKGFSPLERSDDFFSLIGTGAKVALLTVVFVLGALVFYARSAHAEFQLAVMEIEVSEPYYMLVGNEKIELDATAKVHDPREHRAIKSTRAIQDIPSDMYEVKSGENLTVIGEKYGKSPEYLLALNPAIINPDMIYPGQIIRVVDPIQSEADQAMLGVHLVVTLGNEGAFCREVEKAYKFVGVKNAIGVNALKENEAQLILKNIEDCQEVHELVAQMIKARAEAVLEDLRMVGDEYSWEEQQYWDAICGDLINTAESFVDMDDPTTEEVDLIYSSHDRRLINEHHLICYRLYKKEAWKNLPF